MQFRKITSRVAKYFMRSRLLMIFFLIFAAPIYEQLNAIFSSYYQLYLQYFLWIREALTPLARRIFGKSIYHWKWFRKVRWYKKLLSIVYSFFLSIICFVVAIEINFLWLFGSMPSIDMVSNPDLDVASEIYSEDGVLLGKYFRENREPVIFGELGENIVNCLIVTEDVRFYKHWGIDFRSIGGAVVSTVKGDKRGGSTLTQQLAKNLFKTRREKSSGLLGYIPGIRTVVAKSKEWITAIKLEVYYTKNDILAMYLNTVDFGHNTFGIKVASQSYFGVSPAELSIPQAATLVGMLKAPTTYSPIRHPERSLERRNVVIGQLKKYGKITEEEYQQFIKAELGVNFKAYSYDEGLAPYFRTAVAKSLAKWEQETGHNIYRDGLIIHTTLNSRMQYHAERAVALQMKELQQRFNIHWYGRKPWSTDAKNPDGFLPQVIKKSDVYKRLKKQFGEDEKKIEAAMNEKKKMKVFTWDGEKEMNFSSVDSIKHYLTLLQCGMMTIDPYTAEVKAYVGGISYKYFKYDHVTQAMNQPGSTFKPFVYATAIEQGYSPCDKLPDLPVAIKYKEDGKDQLWKPHNADWSSTGFYFTLRQAMARSINTITARLTEKVGWHNVAETARKMGIKSPLKEVPSIGLGSNDVTLIEMVAAYAVFMNKGLYQEPVLVTKITDRAGNVVAEFKPEAKRALSEETAWLMTYMLRGGTEEQGGTSLGLWAYRFLQGNQVGGKTGTSSSYADGWYMGVTKDYVTGVWVGADDNRIRFRSSDTGEGARTAMPVFGRFMDLLYSDKKFPVSKGKFPLPAVKITKTYQCFNPVPVKDSTAADSTSVITIPDEMQPEINPVIDEDPAEN